MIWYGNYYISHHEISETWKHKCHIRYTCMSGDYIYNTQLEFSLACIHPNYYNLHFEKEQCFSWQYRNMTIKPYGSAWKNSSDQ